MYDPLLTGQFIQRTPAESNQPINQAVETAPIYCPERLNDKDARSQDRRSDRREKRPARGGIQVFHYIFDEDDYYWKH
jgi:hypothetical protein